MYQKPLSSQVLVSPCNPSPDELEQTLIPKSHQNHQTLESEKENRNKIDPNYYSWGSKILFLGLLSHLNCLNSNDLDPSRCSCPSALAAASTNLPDDLPKWCPFQTSEARLYKICECLYNIPNPNIISIAYMGSLILNEMSKPFPRKTIRLHGSTNLGLPSMSSESLVPSQTKEQHLRMHDTNLVKTSKCSMGVCFLSFRM